MRELTDERSSSQADAGCINQEVENNAERQHFGQASSPDRNRRRQRLAGFRRRGGNRSERAGGGRDTLRQPRLERHGVGAGYRLRADRSQPVGGGARCLVVDRGGADRSQPLGSRFGGQISNSWSDGEVQLLAIAFRLGVAVVVLSRQT